jgi:hypothetical protein
VLFFTAFVFSPSTDQKLMYCIQWLSLLAFLNILIAYSETNLRSNGDRTDLDKTNHQTNVRLYDLCYRFRGKHFY